MTLEQTAEKFYGSLGALKAEIEYTAEGFSADDFIDRVYDFVEQVDVCLAAAEELLSHAEC